MITFSKISTFYGLLVQPPYECGLEEWCYINPATIPNGMVKMFLAPTCFLTNMVMGPERLATAGIMDVPLKKIGFSKAFDGVSDAETDLESVFKTSEQMYAFFNNNGYTNITQAMCEKAFSYAKKTDMDIDRLATAVDDKMMFCVMLNQLSASKRSEFLLGQSTAQAPLDSSIPLALIEQGALTTLPKGFSNKNQKPALCKVYQVAQVDIARDDNDNITSISVPSSATPVFKQDVNLQYAEKVSDTFEDEGYDIINDYICLTSIEGENLVERLITSNTRFAGEYPKSLYICRI